MVLFNEDLLLLRASRLVRSFGRKGKAFVAVADVSLDVGAGQVHGLLGPNGAGKTTIVRMCATLLAPTSGEVWVEGIDAVRHPERARARLGLVLGGELGFYPRATAYDNLLFFADLQGLDTRRRRTAVIDALERVGLAEAASRKTADLSRGMRQRLHLARALLGSPSLLLLDEPTTGLDPDVALQVRDLVRELAQQGSGVLLTSHSMPEVEELADIISVIGAGRIVVRGGVGDVSAFAGVSATTTFTLPARHGQAVEALRSHLGSRATVEQRASSARWAVTVYWANETSGDPGADERVLSVLGAAGVGAPSDLVTRPASLEEAYLALADRLAR